MLQYIMTCLERVNLCAPVSLFSIEDCLMLNKDEWGGRYALYLDLHGRQPQKT